MYCQKKNCQHSQTTTQPSLLTRRLLLTALCCRRLLLFVWWCALQGSELQCSGKPGDQLAAVPVLHQHCVANSGHVTQFGRRGHTSGATGHQQVDISHHAGCVSNQQHQHSCCLCALQTAAASGSGEARQYHATQLLRSCSGIRPFDSKVLNFGLLAGQQLTSSPDCCRPGCLSSCSTLLEQVVSTQKRQRAHHQLQVAARLVQLLVLLWRPHSAVKPSTCVKLIGS